VFGTTISIYLIHADPKRLRTAELTNWTGKAVAGPRSEFEEVLMRDEAGKSGVYFLTGSDPDSGKAAIYIGEGETIRDRVKAHLDKDFWNQIIFFTSKDENLTKAHIRHLEGQLISLAKKADRALVMNGQSSGAKLSESERAAMGVFCAYIQQLLPVLGVDLLVAAGGSQLPSGVGTETLYCDIKGLKAIGHRAPDGFLVRKGSHAVLADRPSAKKYPWASNMRVKLKKEGVLADEGDRLIFKRDHEFSSPSAAAAVIHGGHVNGLTAWKDKTGKTLKDLESASQEGP
jgi:hypothetical protein